MASFEDYDEFGNYIGADLDSDEEEIPQQKYQKEATSTTPLEGYDDELMEEGQQTALMEVDGAYHCAHSHRL